MLTQRESRREKNSKNNVQVVERLNPSGGVKTRHAYAAYGREWTTQSPNDYDDKTMKFIDLLKMTVTKNGNQQATSALKQCVDASKLNYWQPGDPIDQSEIRILIGVSTWSGYDLELLDRLNDFFAHHPAKTIRLTVDIFNTDDWARLDQYIPNLRIETVIHSPFVGVWRNGQLESWGSGYADRLMITGLLTNGSL